MVLVAPTVENIFIFLTAISYWHRGHVYFSVARGKAADCELTS